MKLLLMQWPGFRQVAALVASQVPGVRCQSRFQGPKDNAAASSMIVPRLLRLFECAAVLTFPVGTM